MIKTCSECGGVLSSNETENQTLYKCMVCERERVIKTKIIETIDMSDTADLKVIME